MNNRLKFRATFPVSYYDENGNDKDIKLTIYDVAVYSGGGIGFSAQQMETIIDALKLPEVEQDTMWQFINDNYATSSYEWFVCDNAIIEQCTGFSDRDGNLIYEGDILTEFYNPQANYIIKWDEKNAKFGLWYIDHFIVGQISRDGGNLCWLPSEFVITGNIHEQAEQKDK